MALLCSVSYYCSCCTYLCVIVLIIVVVIVDIACVIGACLCGDIAHDKLRRLVVCLKLKKRRSPQKKNVSFYIGDKEDDGPHQPNPLKNEDGTGENAQHSCLCDF